MLTPQLLFSQAQSQVEIARGKRLFTGVILLVFLWTVFAICVAITDYALYKSSSNPGYQFLHSRSIPWGFLFTAPLFILSCTLFFLFSIRSIQVLQIRFFAFLICFLTLLFLPSFNFYSHILDIIVSEYRSPSLSTLLENWMKDFSLEELLIHFILVTFVASTQVGFAFMRQHQQQKIATNVLEHHILELKLKRLQTELVPPFLVKSLEDVTLLIMNADQLEAMDALVQLSDVLRYVLDSSQNARLSVDDELTFIANYLSLQNRHPGQKIIVQWELGHEDWTQYSIPPLIVLPIIELALQNKQGQLARGAATIRIGCKLADTCVQITVAYSHDDQSYQSNTRDLAALKERLSMLFEANATVQELTSTLSDKLNHSDALNHGFTLTLPIGTSRNV